MDLGLGRSSGPLMSSNNGGREMRELDGFVEPAENSEKIHGRFLLPLLIALTVGDIVLGAILFDQFTEVYAQYLNIATAFVYCVVSSFLLWARHRWRPQEYHVGSRRSDVSGVSAAPAMSSSTTMSRSGVSAVVLPTGSSAAPRHFLLCVGLLNGTSNFLLAIAQPHTAGLTQSLLSLLGVPLVMLLSLLFLSKKPSTLALAGAALILAGALVSALRTVFNDTSSDSGITTYFYSVLLFIAGQTVLAGEKVFEESVFSQFRRLDPLQMFCTTMWIQLFLYLPLLPTQTFQVLGGLELREIPLVLWDGVKCTFGQTSVYPVNRSLPTCSVNNSLLFFAYAIVDMSCYFCGLYVIQKRGANVLVIASAVALPLQQLVFCLAFVVTQKYVEQFFGTDLLALLLVGAGYYVYQFLSPEGKRGRRIMDAESGTSRRRALIVSASDETSLAELRAQFTELAFFRAKGGIVSDLRRLAGGQQNHNFLVMTNGQVAPGEQRSYVVRVPGVDAAEHGQTAQIVYANAFAAYEGGVAPRPCFFDPATGLIVTEFVEGETLTVCALKNSPELLTTTIATIRRIHADVKNFIPSKASDFLFGYDLDLLSGWISPAEIQAARRLQSLLARWLEVLGHDQVVCCHQDLTPANFISRGGNVVVLDWEWAGPGDPLCDLATFCALSEQDEAGESAVLAAYLGRAVGGSPLRTKGMLQLVPAARVRLWRVWFALRGALWARQKAQSPHFGGKPSGPDDDYNSFAEQDVATFCELVARADTQHHIKVLEQCIVQKETSTVS